MQLTKHICFAILAASTAEVFQSEAAAFLTVPQDGNGVEGGGAINAALQNGARTLQIQIAASQLGLTVGDTITGLTYRINGGSATGPVSTFSFADYEITLAQAANSIGSFSTTFADNMSNPVLVRDGGLTITASSFPGGSVPNSFGPTIGFSSSSYTYQGGDLVVLISHTAADGGSGLSLDAFNETANYVAQRALTFNAATATQVDDPVTVMQFEVTPVPEATTYGLVFGAGLLAFAGFRRFQKQ